MMNSDYNSIFKKSNFEAVYKSSFFMERNCVSSPLPSQNYHYHNCYELYYLYSGERYYFIKDKTYHVEAGTFVLIKPFEIHCTANFAKYGYDRLLINFKKDYLQNLLIATDSSNLFECFDKNIHTITLNQDQQHFAELLLKSMLKEYHLGRVLENDYLKLSLMQLLMFVSKNCSNSDENIPKYVNSTHKVISEITGYINNHYYDDITLSSISDCFYISPCYFSRIFKKLSGLSFTEYLNNVRVKEARKLLYKTDMSMAEIAEATGFKSNTHFDRIFKKITGVSPSIYKKANKK